MPCEAPSTSSNSGYVYSGANGGSVREDDQSRQCEFCTETCGGVCFGISADLSQKRQRGKCHGPEQLQRDAPRRVPHSINSSALARSFGGTVMPSALAVFILMTSWKRVGCSTGKSAGWAPLRILSTYMAAL